MPGTESGVCRQRQGGPGGERGNRVWPGRACIPSEGEDNGRCRSFRSRQVIADQSAFREKDQVMEVGEISHKIGRGRHTTRHTQLFYLGNIGPDTYFLDTPGFSSLEVFDVESRDLAGFYEEFAPYAGQCRFLSCMHISEPDCAVKEALEKGLFCRTRYENYVQLAGELKRKEEMRYR